MTSTATHQHEAFEVTNLPTTTVTVYADRAEVKRQLKANLKAGANEIIVKKLTDSIDKESIRVEGHGNATLVEVLYQEKYVKKEEELRGEEKELTAKLEKLREERQSLQQKEKRTNKQRELLDSLVDKITRAPTQSNTNGDNGGLLFAEITPAHLQGLDSFMEYFGMRSENLDQQLAEIKNKKQILDEEIQVLENNLQQRRYNQASSLSREVSIILDAQEAGPIELDISYIVWNASWKPSYDLRVYAADRDMKIFYYGLVRQNTGESWNDVKLSLSTAAPSVGGQIPELGTLKVGFHKPPPPQPSGPVMTAKCFAMPQQATGGAGLFGAAAPPAAAYAMESAPMAKMQIASLDVQESVLSTSFEITRPTSVPSDNAAHKVTVALIDLKPDFEYETVPSKSPSAYLKARVKNTSIYPLLAGPTSVFLDNNFVSKGQLKAVSPQEEFSCSLGVDPSIRIEYKPARKFHEETGLLAKSSVITHEQKINIKNTRGDAIKITVVEHLPLSTEEKVKVHLIEPQLRENTKTIRVDKSNNLKWDLQVNAGEAKEIVLKYQVEHPRGEQLEYNEE